MNAFLFRDSLLQPLQKLFLRFNRRTPFRNENGYFVKVVASPQLYPILHGYDDSPYIVTRKKVWRIKWIMVRVDINIRNLDASFAN